MSHNSIPQRNAASPEADPNSEACDAAQTVPAMRCEEPESAVEYFTRLLPQYGERTLALHASPRMTAAAIIANGRHENPAARQLFVAHSEASALQELWRELTAAELGGGVLLYHGGLRDFLREVPCSPTLLYAPASLINPEAVRIGLVPGVPVLAVGSTAEGSGRGGIEVCLAEGLLEPVDTAGPVQLFRTTIRCQGNGAAMSAEEYRVLRGSLCQRYFLEGLRGAHTPVGDLTERAWKGAMETVAPGVSGYGPWPYVKLDLGRIPDSLPDGAPWPKISIVTPTFNQAKYIEQTILSVLNQDYPSVEYIVIDGGSTDETPGILERYRDRLAYVASEPDRGQSHAINKGMARATGEIVTWLNSDDMLAPGALAAVALAFHTSEADMVAGLCQLYSDGRLVGQHLPSCEDGPLPLDDILDLDSGWNAGEFFYQPEVMFKRSVWLQAGGHVDESLYYSMDYELWVRFAEAGARIHVIGHPVAWFRLHAEQKTHVQEKFKAELEQFRKDHLARTGRTFEPRPVLPKPRSRLRIAFLNDHGFEFGAGIAHKRMADGAAWAGHDVLPIALGDPPAPNRPPATFTSQEVAETVAACAPDLVVVGNLHSIEPSPDAGLLVALAERFPTVCVIHDFWLLTGRCGYPLDCGRYLQGCDDSCATAHEYPRLEASQIAAAWAAKRSALKTCLPRLLTNSEWAADFVRRTLAASGAPCPPIATFRLGVPLDVFQPLDKRMCRRVLGLPQNKFIVLTTSEFSDRRKGVNDLLHSLHTLRLPDLLLVSTSWSEVEPEAAAGLEIKRLGYVKDASQLAMIYAAADVLVAPSKEETFGQCYIEAIACGTPVIGRPSSGIREAIADNVTGRLAGGEKAGDLGAAILELYRSPSLRKNLAGWGRLYIENEWSILSGYRHFFLGLNRLGLLESLGVQRNIPFLPAPNAIRDLRRLSEQSKPPQGASLCPAEGPLPEHDLPRFQWAVGPYTQIELEPSAGGSHLLAIYYRNIHENQVVAMDVNGVRIGERRLAQTGLAKGRLLAISVELRPGQNTLGLEFSRWFRPNENDRPLAMIITKITIVAQGKA